MDQFADRLNRLAELSPEELAALETEMVTAFDAADGSGDVEAMQALADALDQVRQAKSNAGGGDAVPAAPPVAAAAETAEAAETEEPKPVDVTVTTEAAKVQVSDATAAVDTPKAPAEPPAAATDEPPPIEATTQEQTAPEATEENAVATEVTNADVPDAHRPVPVSASAPYAITAGGDIPGITAGQTLNDMDELVDAMTRKINGMRGVGGDGEHVIVASLRRDLNAEYGEERLLRRGDPEGNTVKIRKYNALYQDRESLTAAGWCAPKTPMYDVPGIGSTDTPVADSLPSFGVDRGGIIWQEPPTLGDMTTALGNNVLGFWRNTAAAGAAATWQWVGGVPAGTIRTDGANASGGAAIAGGLPLKPCFDIPCGVERSTEIMAIPLCLCFDNLMTRANPEMVKATTDLVMVAQARFKEQWLLANIFGAQGVTNASGAGIIGLPDTSLGAARDFLVTMRLAAAQFRWRNRISLTTQMRLYAPAWLRDAMSADLTVQMPGDDTLSVGWSEVDGYFNDINVDPVWYMDDIPVGIGVNPTTAGSNFDSPLGYPTPAEWLLTLPGVFTRLDGGSLDLGVVRTKEDVQQNKYCEFAETFESVAYMGPSGPDEAWALRGTTPVNIRGGFTPAVTVAGAGVIVE